MKYCFITLLAFILAGWECKKASIVTHYCGIRIFNNSSNAIGTMLGYNYPDTSVPKDFLVGGVVPGDYRFLDTRGYCDDVFKSLPQDTISIFVFNIDTVSHYPWEEIRNGYKILKRYDLSQQDLDRMNWAVTYP